MQCKICSKQYGDPKEIGRWKIILNEIFCPEHAPARLQEYEEEKKEKESGKTEPTPEEQPQ